MITTAVETAQLVYLFGVVPADACEAKDFDAIEGLLPDTRVLPIDLAVGHADLLGVACLVPADTFAAETLPTALEDRETGSKPASSAMNACSKLSMTCRARSTSIYSGRSSQLPSPADFGKEFNDRQRFVLALFCRPRQKVSCAGGLAAPVSLRCSLLSGAEGWSSALYRRSASDPSRPYQCRRYLIRSSPTLSYQTVRWLKLGDHICSFGRAAGSELPDE